MLIQQANVGIGKASGTQAREGLFDQYWGVNRMMRKLLLLLAVAICPAAIGCSMCQNCLDYEYGAYGGVCTDASCGARAGSRFAGNASYYEPVDESGGVEYIEEVAE